MEGCISILVLILALVVAAADDGSLGVKQEPTLNFKVKSLASCLVNRDGQNTLDRWSACLESMKHNEQLEESHTSDGNELDVYVNRQGDIRGKIAGAFAQAQQVIANDVGGVFFRGFSYAKSLIGTRDPISNSSSSAEDKNAPSEVADYSVQESKEIGESAALGREAQVSPEAQQPNKNSMGNLEDEVLEHQLNPQNFETDKLDEEDVIMVPQSRFTSNSEVPIQDESAGDESRKSLLLPFAVSAFMGVLTALLRKNRKRNKIARISKGEHSALCMPLGFALATTFAEVLRVDSYGPQVISKDELVELLEITMKNALFPVLDTQCGPFIDNLMKSFTMSYNTITSAQCLREKRSRASGASVKDCNNPQGDEDVSKVVRNKHLGCAENELLDKVLEVQTEDSSVFSPEQLHKLDEVHGTLTTLTGSVDEDGSQELVQKFQHLSIGDAATMNQQPRMGDIMLSSALSSASRTSHHSTSGAIHLFERYVVAQERRNCIKYMGLIEKERRTSMKEEQLQLTSEANTLMKENVEVTRSKFAFRRLEAHNQSLAATCSDLSSRCGDDFVAGLLIMGFSMVYCARKHCPVWLSELWTICQPDYKAKPTYSWQYMSWLYNVLEVYSRASLCVLKGTLGIIVGGVSFVTLAFLLFKMSTPSQSMPATIVVVIGGGVVGFAGKMTVELLGGNGLHWLIVWELLCCVHAFSNYFTESLVYLLHGTPDKSGRRRYYAMRRFAFHAALGYILPALAGLIAFPKVLENSGLLQLPTGILS